MTDIAIQKQIEAIKKANFEARKSKETARKFLLDAGIIKDKQSNTPIAKKKK